MITFAEAMRRWGTAKKDEQPTLVIMPNHPQLLAVQVQPVMFNGEPVRHKLMLVFDRGEIEIASNGDGLRMEESAAHIRHQLGIEI